MRLRPRRAFAAGLLACAGPAWAQAPAPPVLPNWVLDLTHTFATVELPTALSTVRARFDKKAGTLQLDRDAKAGRVDFTVETASLSTGSAALDGQLRGWLDTAAHPQARFVGDAFTFQGQRVAAVAGTLTVAGRSVPVTLTASNFNCYTSPLFKREVCGGDFAATLSRAALGLGPEGGGWADTLRLVVQIEAVRS